MPPRLYPRLDRKRGSHQFWETIEVRCGEVCSDGPGMPPLPTGLMAGQPTLKHRFNLSDEELDTKLLNRARGRLVTLAGKAGLDHRQPYTRVGKFALIRHQRYAHAKHPQDIPRPHHSRYHPPDAGEDDLLDIFRKPLHFAARVLEQRQNQRGKKINSLRAPEVEYIGKGKAHTPYEFDVKVPIATTLQRLRGGHFTLHAMAPPGSPHKYLGRTEGNLQRQVNQSHFPRQRWRPNCPCTNIQIRSTYLELNIK